MCGQTRYCSRIDNTVAACGSPPPLEQRLPVRWTVPIGHTNVGTVKVSSDQSPFLILDLLPHQSEELALACQDKRALQGFDSMSSAK